MGKKSTWFLLVHRSHPQKLFSGCPFSGGRQAAACVYASLSRHGSYPREWAGGATPDALKLFSHGSSQAILDLYTTSPWPALCEAMLCVELPMPTPEKPEPPPDGKGLTQIAHQQPLGDACYGLATALSADGP